MAYKSVKELMTAIADKIRFHLETDSKIKSTEIPQKIDDVKELQFEYGYNHGLTVGDAEGYDRGLTKGIEQGKKAQYDEFWDTFQDKGKRKSYYNAFNCVSTNATGWSDTIYNPKYEINCTGDLESGAIQLFHWNTLITDTKVPINIQGNNVTRSFYGCVELKRIPSLKVNAQTAWHSSFGLCGKLQDLTIEGTLGQNGLNLQWSTKLSKASWISIVNAYSATISNLSMTGSLVSVNKAFETSEGANDGSTSEEWLNLIASKPNVTFNLI